MHKALQIAELVLLILHSLDNSSLARTARTCRSIHILATSLLWKSIDSHAFLSLAEGLLHKPDNTRQMSTLSMAARWVRFEQTAAAVQDLSLVAETPTGNETEIRGRVCQMLRRLACTGFTFPLFPNLRTFYFCPTGTVALESGLIILCPSIRELEISVGRSVEEDAWPVAFTCLLELISRRAPHLRRLDLDTELLTDVDQCQAVAELVSRCQQLENFGADAVILHPLVLQSLARHNMLQKLRVWPKGIRGNTQVDPSSIVVNSFPALRILDMIVPPRTAQQFVVALQGRLEEFKLVWITDSFQDPVEKEDLKNVAVALSGNSQLKTLWVSLSGALDTTPSILWELLTPLFLCKCMSQFHLEYETVAESEVSDDNLIETLARAWPHLTSFGLLSGDPWHFGPVTLLSLISLTQHCPALRVIRIPHLDTTHVPRRPHPHKHTVPTQLRVRTSNIKNPHEVEAFLAARFVDIEIVVGMSCGTEERAVWKRIDDNLKKMRRPQLRQNRLTS